MKLAAIILELVKTGFTIENTIHADLVVTALRRKSDNAFANVLSTFREHLLPRALSLS
jgi:hypothetical protein